MSLQHAGMRVAITTLNLTAIRLDKNRFLLDAERTALNALNDPELIASALLDLMVRISETLDRAIECIDETATECKQAITDLKRLN